jgi:hypothetical protein
MLMDRLDLNTPSGPVTQKYDNIIEVDKFTRAIRIAQRLRREGIKAKVLPEQQGIVPLCIMVTLNEAEQLAGRLEYDSQVDTETRLDHHPC